MLPALYTCVLWLSTSSLWAVQAQDPNAPMNSWSPHRGLAPTNVDFAFNLYQHLMALAPDKNIFISPVSISMALAMLSLGARGHTQTQLLQGLGFNLTTTSAAEIHSGFRHLHHLFEQSDTSLEMNMGNAMFLDHCLKLLDSFSADIKHYYEAETLAANFQDWNQARRQIIDYVQNKMPGKIEDVFSNLENPATLILVNYMTLKFDPENTREGDFYVNETSTVKLPMMFQSSTIHYLRDSVIPCQLVQMNYVGNGTVFFILPDQGQMDTVITALNRDTIQRWSRLLAPRQVNLYIPKISISGTYDLERVLVDMGIADLFTNQSDFSGITQDAPLKISKVIHKAVLQLDEDGIGPAVTRGVPLSLASDPLTISFNQPFIIQVFDHFTWSSLFMGKVVNPA
uniref:Corticosteroid-binding globulin n=1 Tax=Nannospalax galili TaxID=1026970 RepID=A0A8C6R8P3_NANGA